MRAHTILDRAVAVAAEQLVDAELAHWAADTLDGHVRTMVALWAQVDLVHAMFALTRSADYLRSCLANLVDDCGQNPGEPVAAWRARLVDQALLLLQDLFPAPEQVGA